MPLLVTLTRFIWRLAEAIRFTPRIHKITENNSSLWLCSLYSSGLRTNPPTFVQKLNNNIKNVNFIVTLPIYPGQVSLSSHIVNI